MPITSFLPDTGRAGTDVIVTGTGFSNSTGAQVSGEPAPFLRVSDTEVRIAIPDAATTGKITILDPDGNHVSTNDFVIAVPTAPETTQNGLEALDTLRLATLSNAASDARGLARHLAQMTTVAGRSGTPIFLSKPPSSDIVAMSAYETALLANFADFVVLVKMIIIGSAVIVFSNNGVVFVLRKGSTGMQIVLLYNPS